MQFLHTRERLICHFSEKSKRCRLLYGMTLQPLSEETVSHIEEFSAYRIGFIVFPY